MSGMVSAWGLACWWVLVAASTSPPAGPPAKGPPPCELKIEGHSVVKLRLERENHPARQLLRPGEHVLLPAGRYRVKQVQLEGGCFADLRGDREEEWFELAPDRPYELVVGAPLAPKVAVSRRGAFLRLDYKLVDAAGRSYRKDNSANPLGPAVPPRFAVYMDGRQVGSGSFRYG